MSRRVNMPAADDLFRPTAAERVRLESVEQPSSSVRASMTSAPVARESTEVARAARSSGRVRHDEKMTVYVTADELLDIEHARLSLRRMQGVAVDRGRLVREAIAIALADLEANGDESVLVQRLSAS